MRVIAGTARGRRLIAPKTRNIRPVLDKVKGAVFNILHRVDGFSVLDLFAGTGAIGIEALSRGAAYATFVDSSRAALAIINRNIRLCGFEDRSRIFPRPVGIAISYFARHGERFDLVFVDPPYLKDLVNQTLVRIAEAGILSDGGRIIVEHHPKEPLDAASGLVLTDTRKYGQTSVSFLCQRG